jgi:hypothetical protein
MEPTKLVENGIYQHFRNKKLYLYIGVARHSETAELMILYKPLYDTYNNPNFWVRPKSMFQGHAKLPDGTLVNRFDLIGKL